MNSQHSDSATGQLEIKASVLAYLYRHPDAADTLDGIVNWWLPQQRYESACQRVQSALNELVAAGQLRRDTLPGGAALYTLNDALPPLH
jgi:hypothetical protein